MMNTFDLTVDHLYWELRQNPWAVKNQLDWFVDRYSYEDKVRFPGDTTEYPGGLSFTHDMGTTNMWSRPGYSCYEKAGLTGCFSYMTHEQMVNWVCCATVYVEHSGDEAWLDARWPIFEACFESLLNRDHPDPAKRRGLMQLDSARCAGGAEITTYDSLDVSLGQSRNNIYLAGKTWASYLALEKLFLQRGDTARAQNAHQQARRTMQTLLEHVGGDGTIPAVLEGGNNSKIIPAIEGLIFPLFTGCRSALDADGEFGPFGGGFAPSSARHTEARCVLVRGWRVETQLNFGQFLAQQNLSVSVRGARNLGTKVGRIWGPRRCRTREMAARCAQRVFRLERSNAGWSRSGLQILSARRNKRALAIGAMNL